MLFNSPLFLFAYLPVFLVVYFVLGAAARPKWATVWVALASLFFYSWDDPAHLLPIILISIGFNFCVGRALVDDPRRKLLIVGVAGNLLFLFFFKYLNFAFEVAASLGLPNSHSDVRLPIGISFYTFTQIAFLVDMWRTPSRKYGIAGYTAFVTIFPHLIAGPILHHKAVMPQLEDPATSRPRAGNIALGLAWFAVGLVKKVLLADNLGPIAEKILAPANVLAGLSSSQAWLGALSYYFQLYFDFSGYSDMAIGLALMMGITFPVNFNSPYKAASVIDFWRRWHITLSNFLRDYLYVPLGGNRRGAVRRYVNLLITMTLGGLWHGASGTFVFWGALHGAALVINHLAASLTMRFKLPVILSVLLTQLFVLLAWVPFRAPTLSDTFAIWSSMFGKSGSAVPYVATAFPITIVVVSALIVLFLPNTTEIFRRSDRAAYPAFLMWRPTMGWAVSLGVAFGIAVGSCFTQPTTFLYFRF